jgi:hypothetical protein
MLWPRLQRLLLTLIMKTLENMMFQWLQSSFQVHINMSIVCRESTSIITHQVCLQHP